MKSRLLAATLLTMGFAAVGAGINGGLKSSVGGMNDSSITARRATPAGDPVARLCAGLLGGFRGLAADLLWLKCYAAWERQDPAATAALIEATLRVDDRTLCFWLNGARMIAYDFPTWAAEKGSGDPPSVSERAGAETKHAERAIALLRRGAESHPHSAELWIEQANLQLNRLHDMEAAAESYRRAAEEPQAPFYAARLHAEMLRGLGRNAEALAWLRRLYPTLPKHVEAACADVVLARIRALEAELAVDPEERFAEASPTAASIRL